MMLLNSDIYSGYFAKQRIDATPELYLQKRIAIIDTSFDLSKFPKENIVKPINIESKSSAMDQVPTFDYSGHLVYSNHGTHIIDLFIGKHGLLPSAEIIPIQISNSSHIPAALEHAKKYNADIISISLGFAPMHQAFPGIAKMALLETSKTIPILIAAGNESSILENTTYGKSLLQLAIISNGNLLIVGATKLSFLQAIYSKFIAEARASFSNYAITAEGRKVMLWTPGVNITLGSFLRQMFVPGISGTSIATPLAAIKAIYVSDREQITLKQALGKIQQTQVQL